MGRQPVSHKTKRYPSALSNAQWEQLVALLQDRRGQVGRPMRYAMRSIVNAIFYMLCTGCQWVNLPTERLS